MSGRVIMVLDDDDKFVDLTSDTSFSSESSGNKRTAQGPAPVIDDDGDDDTPELLFNCKPSGSSSSHSRAIDNVGSSSGSRTTKSKRSRMDASSMFTSGLQDRTASVGKGASNIHSLWLKSLFREVAYCTWQKHATDTGYVIDGTSADEREAANLELVRIKKCNLASYSYFPTDEGNCALFRCLAFLTAPEICTRQDCRNALETYERVAQASTTFSVTVHPLYFLACIRVADNLIKDDQRQLLSEFQRTYSTTYGRAMKDGGWLANEEIILINATPVVAQPVVDPMAVLWQRWEDAANALIACLPPPPPPPPPAVVPAPTVQNPYGSFVMYGGANLYGAPAPVVAPAVPMPPAAPAAPTAGRRAGRGKGAAAARAASATAAAVARTAAGFGYAQYGAPTTTIAAAAAAAPAATARGAAAEPAPAEHPQATALCAAGDELFGLVGMVTLKECILEIADEICKRRNAPIVDSFLRVLPGNRNKQPEPPRPPPRYAYLLVGNTGTAKTTAAALMGRLLLAAALDAEGKIVEYTARDALRATAKHFSKEVAALTGGKQGSAPPVSGQTYRKGMHVEVKHGQEWYAGQIVSRNPKNFTYCVRYADGTEDEGLPQTTIRCVSAETTKGGVLILDDAHLLNPATTIDGASILDDVLRAVQADCGGKVAVILTTTPDGYTNTLCAAAPEVRDRFQCIQLEDYGGSELKDLWLSLCAKEGWNGDLQDGDVSVSNVAARQLARFSTSSAFANARSVMMLRDTAIAAAKRRPNHQRRLRVEDIVGVPPTPERIPALAAALQQLHECIGINSVKEAVQGLCDLALSNYHKELHGQRPDAIPLNRLFLGNPGAGKTTVAAIYGQILKHLKLLSKGDVMSHKASDFIGSVVGSAEEKTRSILTASRGCVLIIDEAYNLNDQLFGKAALNTLVECVSGGPGDDIAVILIGYERDVVRMLDEQNPGLRSRFDPAYAFHFEDFTDMELLQIFGAACVRDQVEVPFDVKRAAVKVLAKQRCMKNFGNARAVMSLFSAAKSRMTQRLRADPTQPKVMILRDVLGRDEEVHPNPLQYVEELQGGDDEHGFRTVLRQLGSSIQVCRRENRPVDPVGNFIFTGAPGTGKTTVATKMAQMLHALDVLASDHVVLTTALDLTGQYVGQSKKVVEKKMEEARGGVLFIDEAYKLGEGQFGDETMVKLLGMLTEPEYCGGKTIVILAGYEADMHKMLARNAGMASRFSERVHFSDWSAQQCVELLVKLGKREQPVPFAFGEEAQQVLLQGFEQLRARPGWANVRDAESMYRAVKKCRDLRLSRAAPPQTVAGFSRAAEQVREITAEDCARAVADKIRGRPEASNTAHTAATPAPPSAQAAMESAPAPPPPVTQVRTAIKAAEKTAASGGGDQQDDGDDDSTTAGSDGDDQVEAPAEMVQKQQQAETQVDSGRADSEGKHESFGPGFNDRFALELQRLLDRKGLNSKNGVARLTALDMNHPEMVTLAKEIAQVLQINVSGAQDLLKKWKLGHKEVQDKLREEQIERALALEERRKARVPIWRCAVCGAADKTYIACYVAPYIVRYVEVDVE